MGNLFIKTKSNLLKVYIRLKPNSVYVYLLTVGGGGQETFLHGSLLLPFPPLLKERASFEFQNLFALNENVKEFCKLLHGFFRPALKIGPFLMNWH